MPLIEDDVYAELYFSAVRPRPAKAFDRAGLIMHWGSFSKCLAPGYRVGWAAPGRFMAKVERLKVMTTLSTASLPQAVRIALPALVNNLIGLLKDSSLAYAIGVVELSMIGNRVQAESFQPVPVFITVAVIYLTLTTTLTGFSNALEWQLSKHRA